MRKTSLAAAFAGALLLAWGCGGKVAVDVSPPGTGGTVGNGTGGSTSTGSFTCDFLCGGPIGLCGCGGPCTDGKTRAIGCGGASSNGGIICDCVVDGVTVGMCDSPTLACQLTGSCCEAIFGE